ncbi:MAG: hypothetical protein ACXVB0_12795 [Mucilaginibacter sp.]
MKNIKTLRIILLIIVFAAIGRYSNAQDIVGSWKKTDEVLLKANGKTTNTFKMMVKNMPCFASIVYTFSAGGKMTEQAKECSIVLQKQIAGVLPNSRWKISGGKLIIDVSDANSPVKHAMYQIEFVGNSEMVWTFNYSENPTVPNFTKAKQMQTRYVKL